MQTPYFANFASHSYPSSHFSSGEPPASPLLSMNKSDPFVDNKSLFLKVVPKQHRKRQVASPKWKVSGTQWIQPTLRF